MIYEQYELKADKVGQDWLNKEIDKSAYNSAMRYITNEFRADLWKTYVTVNNGVHTVSLEGRLFNLAWEYGHSDGYSEVENYYLDLVDLVNLV